MSSIRPNRLEVVTSAQPSRRWTPIGCGLSQSKKVDCSLACIALGRAARLVCCVLGVSRSNVLANKTYSSDWVDLRNAPINADDEDP
jgi:hypothetical protein